MNNNRPPASFFQNFEQETANQVSTVMHGQNLVLRWNIVKHEYIRESPLINSYQMYSVDTVKFLRIKVKKPGTISGNHGFLDPR